MSGSYLCDCQVSEKIWVDKITCVHTSPTLVAYKYLHGIIIYMLSVDTPD